MVKIGICTDKDIVIPEKSPAGDTVTLIGEYALMSLKADSVTLINYNYEIDERAFQYGKFKTLNIIGGTPVIGDSAFSSCDDIKTITFQNCKIETGEYSFMNCGRMQFYHLSIARDILMNEPSNMVTLKAFRSTIVNLNSMTAAFHHAIMSNH